MTKKESESYQYYEIYIVETEKILGIFKNKYETQNKLKHYKSLLKMIDKNNKISVGMRARWSRPSRYYLATGVDSTGYFKTKLFDSVKKAKDFNSKNFVDGNVEEIEFFDEDSVS